MKYTKGVSTRAKRWCRGLGTAKRGGKTMKGGEGELAIEEEVEVIESSVVGAAAQVVACGVEGGDT